MCVLFEDIGGFGQGTYDHVQRFVDAGQEFCVSALETGQLAAGIELAIFLRFDRASELCLHLAQTRLHGDHGAAKQIFIGDRRHFHGQVAMRNLGGHLSLFPECVAHLPEGGGKLTDFVVLMKIDFLTQVAPGNGFGDLNDPVQRPGDHSAESKCGHNACAKSKKPGYPQKGNGRIRSVGNVFFDVGNYFPFLSGRLFGDRQRCICAFPHGQQVFLNGRILSCERLEILFVRIEKAYKFGLLARAYRGRGHIVSQLSERFDCLVDIFARAAQHVVLFMPPCHQVKECAVAHRHRFHCFLESMRRVAKGTLQAVVLCKPPTYDRLYQQFESLAIAPQFCAHLVQLGRHLFG